MPSNKKRERLILVEGDKVEVSIAGRKIKGIVIEDFTEDKLKSLYKQFISISYISLKQDAVLTGYVAVAFVTKI